MEPIYGIPPDLVRGPETEGLNLGMAGEANWGMRVMGIEALRNRTKGKGMIIGGVDTGIDETHPLLKQNFLAAKDCTNSSIGHRDRNNHGTHISGTISASDPAIGVATECKFVHGKGLGDGGSGTGTMIQRAMQFCFEQGAKVISMSLGSSGQDPTITNYIKELESKNIWVVCAAGNSGPNTGNTDWPGRSEYAINVAALSENLAPASFTSAGAKIDTAGPGVFIWSSVPGGRLQQMSGTSMATPWVAGVLGLLYQAWLDSGRKILRAMELRELIFRKSTDTHTPGDDNRTGPGWLTPLLLELGVDPILPIKQDSPSV